MDTLGFLELTSIAKGIEAADTMLKTAQVRLIFARPGCPGKYYILISGDVSAVQSSMRAGSAIGAGFVVENVVISHVYPQVIQAINMACVPEKLDAVGVLEFYSVTSAIEAADMAVKSGRISLIDVRLGTGIGGKSFVVLTGDTTSCRTAVEAASRPAAESGLLLNKVVIPRPSKEIFESLI